ncbi:hypothetical protein C6P46_000088 [Rhodotorula mucilaginosa]|uniref:Uncharacterized protein n=1 Tax=Rhodotorula mucilaginosa TaxID=5537 RepID=A0A9P7BAQ4_RHOMI|nr:hypothetical protein C6P46_000088 [Rhodotorula mucilaginosa]
MVADIVRDSTFGQIVNYLSKGRYFPYADQRPDYVVPSRYLKNDSSPKFPRTTSESPTVVTSGAPTLVNDPGICTEIADANKEAFDIHPEHRLDAEKALAAVPEPVKEGEAPYPWLVEFEENDPDRPLNWTSRKRIFIAALIAILTFGVCLMSEFKISQVGAISGLTLFVAAYGISPMILSPIQELPKIGRNPVYIIGLALFVIFQIPEILAKNMATVLIFRFFSGFVGGPALATGGASMGDIFPPEHLAVAIGAWAIGAVSAPTLAPVVGSFAAEAKNWRWPFLELLWLSGATFIVLFFLLPETLESTILVRRAERLRKLTGNELLKAPAEVAAVEGETLAQNLKVTTQRAFRLAIEPSLAVCHIYIGLVYSIFYLWFEALPICFGEEYGFSLGISGLPFLAFVVSASVTFTFYVLYQRWHVQPRLAKNPDTPPEIRLELGVMAGPLVPVSLLIFGWTAGRTHWMGPVVGAGLYLPPSYPMYAASILAGNDLFRSVMASLFPLFGDKYFRALGLGPGCTLLAGLSALLVPVLYAVMKMGPRLRARSRFADAA